MLLLSTIRDDLVKLRLLLGNFLGQLNSWGGYNPSHSQVANPPSLHCLGPVMAWLGLQPFHIP